MTKAVAKLFDVANGGVLPAELMSPTEEAASVAGGPAEPPLGPAAVDEPVAAGAFASTAHAGATTGTARASQEADADPWNALLQAGAQLVAALGAAAIAKEEAHPRIERDPATGARTRLSAASAPRRRTRIRRRARCGCR